VTLVWLQPTRSITDGQNCPRRSTIWQDSTSKSYNTGLHTANMHLFNNQLETSVSCSSIRLPQESACGSRKDETQWLTLSSLLGFGTVHGATAWACGLLKCGPCYTRGSLLGNMAQSNNNQKLNVAVISGINVFFLVAGNGIINVDTVHYTMLSLPQSCILLWKKFCTNTKWTISQQHNTLFRQLRSPQEVVHSSTPGLEYGQSNHPHSVHHRPVNSTLFHRNI